MEDIFSGEVDIPSILLQFFTHLISGPDIRRGNSESKLRRIKSICHDVIFATTAGRMKPSKQLLLGMATKSLTGSKKFVELLNRLGHSVSYSTVEELGTELTYAARSRQILTPVGMTLDRNLHTGVAFDNFDRFVETLTGKNTLHDTVGIAYQIYMPHRETGSIQLQKENDRNKIKAKKKKFSQCLFGRGK